MARRKTAQPALDTTARPTHDPPVPSERVARVLKLAADLRDEEKAELAEELWSTIPDELSAEWREEVRDRLKAMRDAEARGEPVGEALSFDELLRLVKTGSEP
jgi:hypothetical protein